MGFIMLFQSALYILAIMSIVIIVFVAIIPAVTSLILLIIGKKRPKGKRKRFFILAVILAIPPLLLLGSIAYYQISNWISPYHDHKTPLNIAAYAKNVNAVERLLKKDVDPDELHWSDNTTVLFRVCNRKSLDMDECDVRIVELLLKCGADANYQSGKSNNGLTPLMAVIMTRSQPNNDFRYRYQIAELLITNGADVNIKTPNGKTALDYAENNMDFKELLLENGAF